MSGGLRHTRYTDHVLYRLVSAEVRKQRIDRGIEQRRMARYLGLSAPGLHKNETAKCKITLLLFIRMCRAMDLRPGEVLDRLVGWIDDSNLPASEAMGAPLQIRKEK